MARDKPQPLIFNGWMTEFRRMLLARVGSPQGISPQGMELVADALESAGGARHCGGDCGAMLSESLRTALAQMSREFGTDLAAWRWGRAHHAVFAHPVLRGVPLLYRFGVAHIGVLGDDNTLFRGGMFDGEYTAVHGASFRGVYDLADLDRSLFVVAPGQSGHPTSALARNFLRRWRDGGTITLGPRAAVVAATIALVPAPAGR